MRCPACDTPNPPEAVRCEECGKKLPPPRKTADAAEAEEIEEVERPSVKARRRPAEDEDDEDDEEYERRPRRRSVRRHEGDDVVSAIIPYKNPRALTGYYCGIFSLAPVIGLILGPVALILGILGIRYQRANPEAHGTAHAIIAIVAGVFGVLLNLSCWPLAGYVLLAKK